MAIRWLMSCTWKVGKDNICIIIIILANYGQLKVKIGKLKVKDKL